ncbi:MAG: signal peptide peptidase SppA [Planctomycetota bacterium]|nr:MAG: signal peptide peptidase SppA [Planctomycetota bacterium]
MTVRSLLLLGCLAALMISLPAAAQASDSDEGSVTPTIKLVELVISADGGEDPRPQNPLGPSQRNFRLRLEQIRAIAADPSVNGVRLKVEGIPGLARSLDLLDEIEGLKAAGKLVVCYSEALERDDLLFASAADHLCVPPSGMIILNGLLAESMYFKQLLARFDASVEVLHIGDFKTAFEELARDGMSDGQRTTLQNILDEFWEQIVSTIADQRGMQRAELEQLFAQLIVSPELAQTAGLIDQVGYRDAFDAKVEALLGGEYELVEDYGDRTKEDIEKMLESPFALFALLPALLDPPTPEAPDQDYVAIVYATGAINSGESAVDWQGKVSSMGSETIVEALEAAADDEHCKAVVLRVNSPGGSALASDMIWRAVERTMQRKPVVSSMGSLAASGGYWISMGCTSIVAQPSTLTGSIGVVGMLPDVSKTLAANGIKVETVSAGPLGDALALMAHGPSEPLKAAMIGMMQATYDSFIIKVAAGRKLAPEQVSELAKGRVWTGRQAEENGLVDVLGGLVDSIDLACVLAGLDPASTPVFELPEPPNPLEQLQQSLGVMTQARSPFEQLLLGLGFGDALALAQRLVADPRPLHADSVQAVMPFTFVIR